MAFLVKSRPGEKIWAKKPKSESKSITCKIQNTVEAGLGI